MKLENLKKLYVDQLKDLYSAERQFEDALGRFADAANDDELRNAFLKHREETVIQQRRLERVFESLDFEPGGEHCDGAEGLVKEAKGHINSSDIDPQVLDVALVASAQRIEHYEMAGYGTARALAEQLGEHDASELLTQSLEEEASADRELTRLAERSLNFRAMAMAS